MGLPGQRQWKQWLQLCTAPRQAGAAVGCLLYVAHDLLAPLPPDWNRKAHSIKTSQATGLLLFGAPPIYLPSSLLQPTASRIVAEARPELVHFLKVEVRVQNQSSTSVVSVLPTQGWLTSREALARSWSVGHFCSSKTSKKVKDEDGGGTLFRGLANSSLPPWHHLHPSVIIVDHCGNLGLLQHNL